jgi:2'-5' RNA ligase
MLDAGSPPHYALVAYLHGPVAEFVEGLRAELHPARAHLRSHVTILPPRLLCGPLDEAKTLLSSLSGRFKPFDIAFDNVETFAPASPTVFVRVAKSAHRFRDMHVAFNSGALQCEEPWPYIPHLTIVKMDDLAESTHALEVSRQRWSAYKGQRTATIETLTFVREGEADWWVDLETIQLKGK